MTDNTALLLLLMMMMMMMMMMMGMMMVIPCLTCFILSDVLGQLLLCCKYPHYNRHAFQLYE